MRRLAILALLLSACASTGALEAAQKQRAYALTRLKLGQTTLTDAAVFLGKPHTVSRGPQSTTAIWTYRDETDAPRMMLLRFGLDDRLVEAPAE